MAAIRILTDDVTRRITYFYSKPFYTNVGLMFALCFGAPVVGVAGSIGGSTVFVVLAVIWAAIFYLILSAKYRKIKKAKEVYQFGTEETIYYQGMEYDYRIKINGAPQPVITIQKNGETIHIKTFSRRVIAAFEVPVQKAYVMDQYPDIILPEQLFVMNIDSKARKAKSINI